MDFHFFSQIIFMLILTSVLLVSGCRVKVTQPQQLLYGEPNQSLPIPCHVTTTGCTNINPGDLESFWYLFNSDSYYQLDVKSSAGKYTQKDETLSINWLSDKDDGIYFCVVILNRFHQSGMQDIGTGTTLKVKESVFPTGQILLLVLVVLLSLYSVIILSLLICVKMGRSITFLHRRVRTRQVKTDTTRKAHFSAVVQEMYSKRNLRKNKKASSSDDSQGNKVDTHAVSEDLYQNLNQTG